MRQLRILSLDGGGIRGLLSAAVLHEIENRLGSPLHRHFHMIAGVSAGSITASLLAHPTQPRTAAEIVSIFHREAPTIFTRRRNWMRTDYWGAGWILGNRYSARGFEGVLQNYLGDLWLSDVQTDLLVGAHNAANGQNLLLRSWRARGEDDPAGIGAAAADFRLRDVVRASAAAPTSFPMARVTARDGAHYQLYDGAIGLSSNMALAAIADGMERYPNFDSVLMLSVGTGIKAAGQSFVHQTPEGDETVRFAWLISSLINSSTSSQEHITRILLRSGRVPAHYYRFDIPLTMPGRNDNPSSSTDLIHPQNLQRLEARGRLAASHLAPQLQDLVNQLRIPLTPRLLMRRTVAGRGPLPGPIQG